MMRRRILIVDELSKVGERRRMEKFQLELADDRLACLLVEAREHPEMTVAEAARVAGIGRTQAYKLMEKAR